ncbi:MAG TPA: efflux RND transporter periplasmic adaptor subunit [Steroidobacter sp.]|nr:efflux RND transporter periplasmic adaptor subunit [Steroidobacter sp.]
MKSPMRTVLLIGALLLGVILVILVAQDRRRGETSAEDRNRQAVEPSVHQSGQTPQKEATARAPVELSARQIEMLAVQFEPVEMRQISEPVRAVATIVADESRITHVHTRVSGWLEELNVSTTGELVRAGQPLAAVFSQELYSSQQEYLSALRRAADGPASAVLDAARTRLELLGLNRAQIERLEKTGQARRLVTISAPHSGVVLTRGVSAGMAVDPSTDLFTLADLSVVWVIAEVAEMDAEHLRPGSIAMLSFSTSGRDPFPAKAGFIYPTLTEGTRTIRVRLPVSNKDGRLRPGMYGSAEFPTAAREALTVARDAVIDTGESQHVFVHTDANVLEPRKVRVGARLADLVEILEGLTPGEHVVTTGVFLIDSESRLRASGGMAHAGHDAERSGGEEMKHAPGMH